MASLYVYPSVSGLLTLQLTWQYYTISIIVYVFDSNLCSAVLDTTLSDKIREFLGVRRGRDRMVVRFTATCAISACHHWSCELEPCSWRGVFDIISCDKVCQWLAAVRWFFPDTPVTSTHKSDRHDMNEISLNVALNTLTLILPHHGRWVSCFFRVLRFLRK